MAGRPFRLFVLSTLVLAGNVAAARADKLPAPTDVLKDYDGVGVIQVVRPGDTTPHEVDGKKVYDPGFAAVVEFRQVYVRPDRLLLVTRLFNHIEAKLVQGDVERTYSPDAGYIAERTYKNIEQLPQNPMSVTPLSLATYAKLLQETEAGKLLPDENLDTLKPQLLARMDELKAKRATLSKSTDPADVPRAQMTAAELARTHDDLEQLDIRRAHPCYLAEFPNEALTKFLSSKGLMSGASAELVQGGKTVMWITRAEGFPIKIEMSDKKGTVILSIIFSKSLKLNQGLHPSEVILGNPPGTRIFRAVADVREKNWEEKLDQQLETQVSAFEAERQKQNQQNRGLATPVPKKKK